MHELFGEEVTLHKDATSTTALAPSNMLQTFPALILVSQ